MKIELDTDNCTIEDIRRIILLNKDIIEEFLCNKYIVNWTDRVDKFNNNFSEEIKENMKKVQKDINKICEILNINK